jgi:hypothetical protein
VSQHLAAVCRVDRHRDRTQAGESEDHRHQLRAVRQHDGDVVALADTHSDQPLRDAVGVGVHVAVGEIAVTKT